MATVLPTPTSGGIDTRRLPYFTGGGLMPEPYYFQPYPAANPTPQPVYVVPDPTTAASAGTSSTTSTSTSTGSTIGDTLNTVFSDGAAILGYIVQNWIVIVILVFAYMLLKKHFR